MLAGILNHRPQRCQCLLGGIGERRLMELE
jgi:hypothetical protein